MQFKLEYPQSVRSRLGLRMVYDRIFMIVHRLVVSRLYAHQDFRLFKLKLTTQVHDLKEVI